MKSNFKFSNLCGTVYRQGNVLFNHEGDQLFSPVGNRVTLFELTKNKSSTLPFEMTANIVRLALSPNDQMLFIADEAGSGVLISLKRKVVLHHFNFKGRIRQLEFSPDSKYFAYSIDNNIYIWNTPGMHKEITPFIRYRVDTSHFDTVMSLSWSKDSKYLISGSKDMTCKIHPISISDKNDIITLSGHRNSVVGCYFSEDMKQIYTISLEGTLIHWKYSTLREMIEAQGKDVDEDNNPKNRLDKTKWYIHSRHSLESNGSKVISTAFHAKSNLLLAGFSKGTFGIWELPEFLKVHSLSISRTKIDTVAVNSTGEWLAFGTSKFGQLLVWEWQSESYILKQQGHYMNMSSMAYSADGQYIATGGQDGKLKVWDTGSGFCFVTFSDHTAPISQVEFTKQTQVVVSASMDGTVRAFDLLRYRNFRTFTTPDPVQFSCLAVDPSGEVICAGSTDTFEVFVWSMQTGRLLDVLAGHEGPISCMAFSPTDSVVATGSWDGTVRVWDAFGRGQAVELLTVGSDVLALAFSPDGQQLAVASLDGSITFWDPKEGIQLNTIDGRMDISGGRKLGDAMEARNNPSNKTFTSLCFTADGQRLLSGGNSKYVCLYDTKTSVLIRKFQISRNQNLDGTREMLNSKKMTEAGNIDEIDDEDDDLSIGIRYTKDSLPGVQRGDLSKRRTLPEVRTQGVRVSPTGRAWAAASTEGLLIYTLDDELPFDPYDLEIDITPSTVIETLHNQDYLKALVMALRLNEKPLIQRVLEAIPPNDIPLLMPRVPLRYIDPLLTYLAHYPDVQPRHLHFALLLLHALLTAHAAYLQQNRNRFLPALRMVHKSITKRYSELSAVAEPNHALLDYLRDAKLRAEKVERLEQEDKEEDTSSQILPGASFEEVQKLLEMEQINGEIITMED